MNQTTAPKTYFDWMDTLRGFGIVLVVFGHQKPGPDVTNFLQAVMLAVFIFASGFLFSGSKYPDTKVYLKKRARLLLIPYLWFTLLSFLFWIFYVGGMKLLVDGALGSEMLAGVDETTALGALSDAAGRAKPGIGVVLAVFILPMIYGSASFLWFNIPLWFFPGLFVIDALFYWLHKRCRTDLTLLAVLIALSMVGFGMGRVSMHLPWNVDTAFSIVVYYGLGYLFRKRYGEGWPLPLWAKGLVAAVLLAVGMFVIVYNPGTHPSFNQQGNYWLYHLGAMTTILSFMLIAQLMVKLKRPADVPPPRTALGRAVSKSLGAIPRVFDYVGNNAVVYIGAQVMTMGVFMTFNRFAFGILAKEKLPSTPWALYYGVGAIILLVPLAYVTDRWAPFILGRKRKKPPPAPPTSACRNA